MYVPQFRRFFHIGCERVEERFRCGRKHSAGVDADARVVAKANDIATVLSVAWRLLSLAHLILDARGCVCEAGALTEPAPEHA